MALPVTYNVRNVFVRWRTTGFTVLGVTLATCSTNPLMRRPIITVIT